MAFSNIVAFCIILGAAATLNAAGVTDIRTSAQAAEALRPLRDPSRSCSSARGSSATA